LTDHGFHPNEHFPVVKKYELGVVIEPVDPADERFTGMLSIPYLTRHGTRAIRFRNLTPGAKPKMAQHDGQKLSLYNPNAYFDARDVIGLAEGEIDAITATEKLDIPTIGLPGAESWKANRRVWAPLFKNFQKVIVFTDGDPVNLETGLRPGEELGKAIRESLKWRARIIECPEGEDVSSMIAAGRSDEIIKQFGSDDDED
jgi:hypothetical protein